MSRKKYLSEYTNAVKRMRSHVSGFDPSDGFDIRKAHDWTPSQKRQITRYADMYAQATAESVHIYRPRNKKNLKIALKSRGLEKFKNLKVAFIPVPPKYNHETDALEPVTPKIKISKGGKLSVKVKDHSSERTYLLRENFGITRDDFINDPYSAAEKILKETDYTYYNIIAGEHEYGRGLPKILSEENILKEVEKMIERYGSDSFDPNDKSSKFYGNWFFGLIGYRFPTWQAARDYRQSERRFNDKKKVYKTKIKKANRQIKVIEKTISKINKHKRMTPHIRTIVNRDITERLKTASDPEPLLELRSVVKGSNDKQQIPPFIKDFLIENRHDKIATQNKVISDLIAERLAINLKLKK